MKPHKISTHLAHSDNCYFHVFYRLSDWVEISRGSRHSFSNRCWKFQLSIFKKKFLSKNIFFGRCQYQNKKALFTDSIFRDGFVFGLICWWWCKGGLTSETFSLWLYSLRNEPKTYLEHLLFRWFGTFFWRWKKFLRSNHPNVCDVLVRKSQKMKQPRCWHFLSVHHTHFLLLHQMSKTSLDKRLFFLIISFYRHEYNVNDSIHVFGGKCQVLNAICDF